MPGGRWLSNGRLRRNVRDCLKRAQCLQTINRNRRRFRKSAVSPSSVSSYSLIQSKEALTEPGAGIVYRSSGANELP
jgi:hypothetical protein